MSDTRPGRRKLLFLCQNLPYPPDGGALIRSYHTLRLLAEHFDVTALCFYRRSSRASDAEVQRGIRGLEEFGQVEAFPIPQEHSRVRLVWDHFRSVVTRRAYTRWAYDSRKMHERIRSLVTEQDFHIVHLDSLDLMAYLPLVENRSVVLAHHNVESQLLARRAETERGWMAAYLRLQARLTEREEARWCPGVSLNLAVSGEDANTLRAIAPGAATLVVPNGVDTTSFRPGDPGPRSGIVFVGGHTWFPNRDGMAYFADEILPLIRRRRPDVEVTWVGRAADAVVRDYADKGITLTGYVDDIRPHVDAAACFIVPLRVGGGTRLKILDAWALGKAVVSTPQGCEGLDVEEGENMLVAETPSTFADAVEAVLADPELRRRLERGGRATAVRRYDWNAIGDTLSMAYAGLLQGAAVDGAPAGMMGDA